MPKLLEDVELASVAGDSVRLEGYDIWRVACVSASGDQVLMIKALPTRKLLAEVVCALIGRAVNLPVPKPYIVEVHAGALEEGFPEGNILAFGSLEEPYPSLEQVTRDPDVVLGLLKRWVKRTDAAAFDTWIANEDRTNRNILFGAAQHAIWLIDHEDALREEIAPDEVTDNQIIGALRAGLTEFELHKLVADTRKSAAAHNDVPVEAIGGQSALPIIRGADTHVTALLSFLAQRRTRTSELLKQQIKPGQQELTLESRLAPGSSGGLQAPI